MLISQVWWWEKLRNCKGKKERGKRNGDQRKGASDERRHGKKHTSPSDVCNCKKSKRNIQWSF